MNARSTANLQSLFIAGPTAVGKSSIALHVAEHINGEIISVDSMQVYRGLDIGTAKPAAAEQSQIRHHLIDVVDLAEPFDAAKFCELAKNAAADILRRGKVPIFCGGTGLYFKAYLEGLGEAPPADDKLRHDLERTPLRDLLAELEMKDAVTFGRIDKQNPRRVIRAVEVIRLTGKPFSEQRSTWCKQQTDPGALRIFGITRDTKELHQRIYDRVDQMFQSGLVEETRQLLTQGLEKNKTAMQAIGYRQVVEHLRGERSLPDTIELIKVKTRQFAKRQLTWFRRQLCPCWIHVLAGQPASGLAKKLVEKLDDGPAR